jgi:hypothetical protein
MNITKIHVLVDKKKYSGLYWLTETKEQNYLTVSYEGLKKSSKHIGTKQVILVEQAAKEMLHKLIEGLQ